MEFLQSDWTMLNENMAILYGMNKRKIKKLRRVANVEVRSRAAENVYATSRRDQEAARKGMASY